MNLFFKLASIIALFTTISKLIDHFFPNTPVVDFFAAYHPFFYTVAVGTFLFGMTKNYFVVMGGMVLTFIALTLAGI